MSDPAGAGTAPPPPGEGTPFGWSGHLRGAPAAPAGEPARAARGLERATLRLAGVRPGARPGLVRGLVLPRRRDAAGYWIHLALSAAIATLGLVLGSTAVVIGAMLVSPLMGPVVELGMGLVTGSPVLTLRSLARTGGGIVLAVVAASLLTLALPFQEITPEIAARTSPTALDLLIAVAVAVVAALSTVRPTSDAASTAAGTAIGISLIPPLCVVGFGIGAGSAGVAGGAALLFLTNLTAIVAVAVLCFLALGFEHVDTSAWDRRALRSARGRGVHRAAELLRALFGSRYGRVVRIGVPVALVGLIAVPLRDALQQVAWEVRARTAVGRGLSEVPAGDVVHSAVSVRGRGVDVRLYLVGTQEEAAAIQRTLLERVRGAVADAEPVVRVVAVPEAAMPAAPATVAVPDPAATLPELAALRDRLGESLVRAWPATGAGPVVHWEVRLGSGDSLALVPSHLGEPVPAAVSALLGRLLLDETGIPVAVRPRVVRDSMLALPASVAEWSDYLAEAAPLLVANRSLQLCLGVPVAADSVAVERTVRSQIAGAAPGQVLWLRQGRTYTARLGLWAEGANPCAPPPVAPGEEAAG